MGVGDAGLGVNPEAAELRVYGSEVDSPGAMV